MLSKRDNHNFKKRRGRTDLKINLKIHRATGQFHLDKRSTKQIKYDEEELWSLLNLFGTIHSSNPPPLFVKGG